MITETELNSQILKTKAKSIVKSESYQEDPPGCLYRGLWRHQPPRGHLAAEVWTLQPQKYSGQWWQHEAVSLEPKNNEDHIC